MECIDCGGDYAYDCPVCERPLCSSCADVNCSWCEACSNGDTQDGYDAHQRDLENIDY